MERCLHFLKGRAERREPREVRAFLDERYRLVADAPDEYGIHNTLERQVPYPGLHHAKELSRTPKLQIIFGEFKAVFGRS